MGPYSPESTSSYSAQASVCQAVSLPSTDDLLRKFWETEEVAAAPYHSPEEKVVLEHFANNHILLPEGRYRVYLPRKPDAPPLGESHLRTIKCFYSNEASITRQEPGKPFRMLYKNIMTWAMLNLYQQLSSNATRLKPTTCLCMLS